MSEDTKLNLLKDLNENKAEGLGNISGKFLKDGATA